MKRVAVLGGGPAGAFTAERLAAAGMDTILMDEKLAWEKPCGGGLTYKAYSQYPFLLDNPAPKKLVSDSWLACSGCGSVRLHLTRPLIIYSRYELNSMLLNRAAAAGAQLEKTRVLDITRRSNGWLLTTRAGKIEADFCVIATGARNPLREVGTRWSPANTMISMGYYVPTDQAHIDIQFFPGLEGYIWVFPRRGHLSVGICGKGESAQILRLRLESYMRTKGLAIEGSELYAHVLPSLGRSAWKSNRVAGDGWLAVGDAAGLVDPITGEGIYYAVRSADLAASLLIADQHFPSEQPEAYRSLLERDFTADLEFAARMAKRLFLGKFLYKDVPARMIQFMRKSPTYCDLVQDLFAGTQSYLDLKSRLMRSLHGTLQEVVINALLRRLIPSPGRA